MAPPPHTVSGFSAGASAALNHQVAFSDVVQGLGIVGGSPYGCNTVRNAGASCSGFADVGHRENTSIPWAEWVADIDAGYLSTRAANGSVAPLSNLVDKPVFLFSGVDDVWVYQSVMRAVAKQFRRLSARVKTEFGINAAHSWVVDNQTCATPGEQRPKDECCGFKNASTACPLPPHNLPISTLGCCGVCTSGDGDDDTAKTFDGWRPPINSCSYDMAGEGLRWVLGAVKPRAAVLPRNLVAVDATRFLPGSISPARALLDTTAFIYVPDACKAPGRGEGGYSAHCRVHVHYHPCGSSWRVVSLSYMLENALPAYAEANSLVLIYPQSIAGDDNNPVGGGCFDWAGATGPMFDTRVGLQLRFVIQMMTDLRVNHPAVVETL